MLYIILFVCFMFSCSPNYTQRNKYDRDSTIVRYDFNLSQKSKTEISLSFTEIEIPFMYIGELPKLTKRINAF